MPQSPESHDLQARIADLWRRAIPPLPPERAPSEKLTHIFDDWNAEIAQMEKALGRVPAALKLPYFLAFVAIMLLLDWLFPT